MAGLADSDDRAATEANRSIREALYTRAD